MVSDAKKDHHESLLAAKEPIRDFNKRHAEKEDVVGEQNEKVEAVTKEARATEAKLEKDARDKYHGIRDNANKERDEAAATANHLRSVADAAAKTSDAKAKEHSDVKTILEI